MLALSFPDFEIGFLAWFAFVPLLLALDPNDRPLVSTFLTGWLFGTLFFFVTCWWLTFAPITYAAFPVIPTYLLLLAATAASGIFAGLFGLFYGFVRRTAGLWALLFAPFLWTATEFGRYWLTGNAWNAVGYSQAFTPGLIGNASLGGVFLTGSVVVLFSSLVLFAIYDWKRRERFPRRTPGRIAALALLVSGAASVLVPALADSNNEKGEVVGRIVGVQPNVPMAGLDQGKWRALRDRQIMLAGRGLEKSEDDVETVVVLPESPMNYQYELDSEFRVFIDDFARRNDVSVLFNSAEPDRSRERGYFNSAVLVGSEGGKKVQYDKIYLLPFGEFVPLPEFAQHLIPPMVGRFSHGTEYDLFDIGGAKAGVMICFESHFGSLSAEYAHRGADMIIEMTNDGYLGDTPVLRQHLANAVFRAVETGRPVFRVTNVGITAKIDEKGVVHDAAPKYAEAVRAWDVRRSSGRKTLYTRAGDWFGFLSLLIAAVAMAAGFRLRRSGFVEGESASDAG